MQAAGELRTEAKVPRAEILFLCDVEIARLLQERAAGGADLRERDACRYRDVEALREPCHRDPESARAGLQGFARRPRVLVAEKKRDRPIGGQLRRRPRGLLQMSGVD